MPDEQIPGTLNVGHALPTIVQAFIFITIVEVDLTTLVSDDRRRGRGRVARRRRSSPGCRGATIQIGMGVALLVAAVLMLAGRRSAGCPAAATALA